MIVGKRGLDERLTTTQILLQQQEEVVRRGDRERRALTDRVRDLERALQASEADKKHTQVRACLCSAYKLSSGRYTATMAIWSHPTVEQYLQV